MLCVSVFAQKLVVLMSELLLGGWGQTELPLVPSEAGIRCLPRFHCFPAILLFICLSTFGC